MNLKDLARLIYPEFRFGKTKIEDGIKLVEAGVGGFCFYGGTKEEVKEAAFALRKAAKHPLLIASDYEEGVGRRVCGMTELPTNMAIGASGSEELAYKKGLITGAQAVSIGVDWVFAPVLDLAISAENPIVSLRSFGENPNEVSRLALAYCKGLNAGGALSSIKHFPGHGRTEIDSHLAMPEINASYEVLCNSDILPFKNLLNVAQSVMVGHLLVGSLDKHYPASLSDKIISGLLKEKLGYKGLVLTDALNMKALEKWGEAGVLALNAGADILLYPEEPLALIGALDKAVKAGIVPESRVLQALKKQEELVSTSFEIKQKAKIEANVIAAEAACFNENAAAMTITRSGVDTLRQGDTIAYFEPCNSWENREGKIFTDALEALGVKVVPYKEAYNLPLVAGVFSGPQAYSGKINLSPEQKMELEEAISSSKQNFVFSFGSPFAIYGLKNKPQNTFCTYGKIPEFLRLAADIALGKAKANGKMPV